MATVTRIVCRAMFAASNTCNLELRSRCNTEEEVLKALTGYRLENSDKSLTPRTLLSILDRGMPGTSLRVIAANGTAVKISVHTLH